MRQNADFSTSNPKNFTKYLPSVRSSYVLSALKKKSQQSSLPPITIQVWFRHEMRGGVQREFHATLLILYISTLKKAS